MIYKMLENYLMAITPEQMTFKIFEIIMLIIAILFILIAKKTKKNWFLIITFLAIFNIIPSINVQANLKEKGMYKDLPIEKAITTGRYTPYEDEIPEKVLRNKEYLIVYYKFGCPDCKVIYKEMKQLQEEHGNIYFVSTRSEQGKKLLKQYPVEEVPFGVYVFEDNSTIARNLITGHGENVSPNKASIKELTQILEIE